MSRIQGGRQFSNPDCPKFWVRVLVVSEQHVLGKLTSSDEPDCPHTVWPVREWTSSDQAVQIAPSVQDTTHTSCTHGVIRSTVVFKMYTCDVPCFGRFLSLTSVLNAASLEFPLQTFAASFQRKTSHSTTILLMYYRKLALTVHFFPQPEDPSLGYEHDHDSAARVG